MKIFIVMVVIISIFVRELYSIDFQSVNDEQEQEREDIFNNNEENEQNREPLIQPIYYGNTRCELINIDMCRTPDIKYNYTIFPNMHNHKNQYEAHEALLLFNMLIESHCSPYIRFYLCSEFVPMCTFKTVNGPALNDEIDEHLLKPCKSMCLNVKNNCEMLLITIGMRWPNILDCDRLPENDLCIKPPPLIDFNENHHSKPLIEINEYEDFLQQQQLPYETNINKLIDRIRQNNLLNNNYYRKPLVDFINNPVTTTSLPLPTMPLLAEFQHEMNSVTKLAQLTKNKIHLKTRNKFLNAVTSQKDTKSESNNNYTMNGINTGLVYCINSKNSWTPSTTSSPTTITWPIFTTSIPITSTIVSQVNETDVFTQCIPLCNSDILFKQIDKNFAELWILILSSLCFVSTFITIIIYIFKSKNFQYPERVLVIISFCYNIYSIGYLLRYFLGFKKANCENYNYGNSNINGANIDDILNSLLSSNTHSNEHINIKSTYTNADLTNLINENLEYLRQQIQNSNLNISENYVLIKESLENTWCTVIFILTYYFHASATIWWTILAYIWCLISNKKYNKKLIINLNGAFHFIAWSIPAIKTIIILIWKHIDGDELTGLCSIGNQDTYGLLIFNIIPTSIYLIAGILFIIFAFIGIYKYRNVAYNQNLGINNVKSIEIDYDNESLSAKSVNVKINAIEYIKNVEKVLFKIGIYTIFSVVPIIYILLVNLYHFINYSYWYLSKLMPINNERVQQQRSIIMQNPIIEIYLLKLFMSLIIGITSAIWFINKFNINLNTQYIFKYICYCYYFKTSKKIITNNSECGTNSKLYANKNVKLKNSSTLKKFNDNKQIYVHQQEKLPQVPPSLPPPLHQSSYLSNNNDNNYSPPILSSTQECSTFKFNNFNSSTISNICNQTLTNQASVKSAIQVNSNNIISF